MSGSFPPATPWSEHPWVAAGQGRIRFGAGVSARAPLPAWREHLALARTLEDLGFDSHWLPDHPTVAPDCWTTLAALAVATERIRLGPIVACVGYRTPVMLARLAADVDRLSDGRLLLGLGCGWVGPEFAWLGLPFPPVPARQRLLAETIEVVHGLWGTTPGDDAPPADSFPDPVLGVLGPPPLAYHGTAYQIEEGLLRHGPVQRPRVPILIAGGGERVTLRQVAKYADASNFGFGMPGATMDRDAIRRKLAVLRRHCVDHGRAYDSVLPTHFANPVVLAETDDALAAKRGALPPIYRTVEGLYATPEAAIAFFRELVDAGLRYFIVQLATYDDLETPRLLAERVFPALNT